MCVFVVKLKRKKKAKRYHHLNGKKSACDKNTRRRRVSSMELLISEAKHLLSHLNKYVMMLSRAFAKS